MNLTTTGFKYLTLKKKIIGMISRPNGMDKTFIGSLVHHPEFKV